MRNVQSLTEYRYRAELAVLRRLSSRVLAGDVRGIALCVKGRDGLEEISVLGNYREDPSAGVCAAMKMSWRLTRLADEMEAE